MIDGFSKFIASSLKETTNIYCLTNAIFFIGWNHQNNSFIQAHRGFSRPHNLNNEKHNKKFLIFFLFIFKFQTRLSRTGPNSLHIIVWVNNLGWCWWSKRYANLLSRLIDTWHIQIKSCANSIFICNCGVILI